MGSSESKMAACAAVKPEPAIKSSHLSHLKDPRSPSTEIHRTPIQVGGPLSKTSAEVKSECPFVFGDPRSPSVGIARTPVREAMRATVGSFARRLGLFFHNEMEGKVPEKPQQSDAVEEEEEELKSAEPDSAEPLLTPRASVTFGALAEHAHLLATPVLAPLQGVGDASPFVVLEEPQAEVEIETEGDVSLEEAEEAKESPLHKRLSMSLITCHEGATSSQIFAEVHHDSTSPSEEVEPSRAGSDHLYALPCITVEPESPVDAPAVTDESPVSATTTAVAPPPGPPASAPPAAPSPDQPQPRPGAHRLTIDSKSPSQVVFKPQWLGKGFGASGPRSRAAHSGKGGSSPLAVSVAVKNATNENKGLSGKLRQKGSEGRSPLQMKNNSPRERPQMKHKVSTPEKPRLGQTDRRVLAVGLDKENR